MCRKCTLELTGCIIVIKLCLVEYYKCNPYLIFVILITQFLLDVVNVNAHPLLSTFTMV